MAGMVKRIKFYGIGFGIGLIFVAFFFSNRGCSWLPSNRVKNAILDRVLVVNEDTKTQMTSMGLSSDDLIQVLNDGDILFGESDKEESTKCYVIEKNNIKFAFTLPYESFISEVFVNVKDEKVKTSIANNGELIHFPADDDLVYIDTNGAVQCQLALLGEVDARDILKMLSESGSINFAESNLTQKPKAEHTIEFEYNDETITARMIWYKNKLNITSFDFPGVEDCKKEGKPNQLNN